MSGAAALILGSIGTVITIAGVLCVLLVHPGFWGLVGGGALVLAIGGSLAGISYRDRKEIEDLFAENLGLPHFGCRDLKQLEHPDSKQLDSPDP